MPVSMVVGASWLCGQTEVAVGVIFGTVAVNLVVFAVACFGKWVPVGAINWCEWFWFGLGLVGCIVLSRTGEMGVFSGIALLVVGLVALMMIVTKSGGLCEQQVRPLHRGWLVLVFGLVMVLGGIGLLFWQRVVLDVCNVPVSLFAVVVTMVVGSTACRGLQRCQPVQNVALIRGLMVVNLLLVTLGVGLLTLVAGGLHIAQSMVAVVLPWVAGMLLVTLVSLLIPQKTARWWSGLVVVLYFVLIWCLF